MPARPFVALLAIALLAGCTGALQPPDDPGTTPPTPNVPVPSGLPCEPDPTPGLSKSLEVLVTETFPEDPRYREELDSAVVGNRTLLAVAREGTGGIDLLDITAPRTPFLLSTWDPESLDRADDLKFTTDGTALVIGGFDTLRVVDARDPLALRLEHEYVLEARGAHMVAVWSLDGRDHVSISKAEGGDLSIFAVEGEAGNRTLRRVSHVAATPLGDLPNRPDPVRSHDTWFEVDPVLDVPLLWVANVYWGIVAYDVSDPAAPVVAATIPNPPPFEGYMHNVQVTHLEGRRLVVAVQEYGTGALKVWDATDLAAPTYVGHFVPDLPTTAFHNLQVVGRYVFATHFDEGLYVLDLAEVPDGPLPEDLPYFAHAPAPAQREGRVPIGLVQGNFGTQDVEVRDGVVWTSEAGTGVRAFAFGCFALGDPAATSTG